MSNRARRVVLALALSVGAAALCQTVARPAAASVSIAISVEALVQRSGSVVIGTPVEERVAYENDRIYTYSRLHVDRPIAGELGTGAEVWVRREGGIVDHVGMLVDGEANLEVGKPCLFFLMKRADGTYGVTGRAQGQFPIVADAKANGQLKVRHNTSAGTLLPPKNMASESGAQVSSAASTSASPNVRLAAEALHDRPVEDVAQDIRDTWKRVRGE